MNSQERRQARYIRRQKKRELAKIKRNEGHDFEKVSSFGALRKSFYQARKGVNWKASVQRYGCNVLRNSYNASIQMRQHKKMTKGFVEFDLTERGKKRHIASVHISERVPQKSVCDYGIVPVIEKSMIYENCASQKGKGTDMAMDILVKHLQKHYRKSGFTNKGYIVLGDEHNFFGSLRHDFVKSNMEHLISDPNLIKQTMEFIDSYPEGLSLGSQVNQINAVGYADKIDHYIKEVLHIKYYARYMDDWYAIVDTKEEADRLISIVSKMYADIGVNMNRKKTGKVKLSHGFIWLQTRVYLTGSGKVLKKPPRKKITRDRRKLKKLKALIQKGETSYSAALNLYESFIGYMNHKNAHQTVRNMQKLFNKLFLEDFTGGREND